jgi:hypothetical protein
LLVIVWNHGKIPKTSDFMNVVVDVDVIVHVHVAVDGFDLHPPKGKKSLKLDHFRLANSEICEIFFGRHAVTAEVDEPRDRERDRLFD